MAEIEAPMQRMENQRYRAILERLHKSFPFWDGLDGKCVCITGAAGMLGALLTDAVMLRNQALPPEKQCGILAVCRNRAAAERRFQYWRFQPAFHLLEQDIIRPLEALPRQPDYWVHAASTSHPIAYASEPVNTILSNVQGIRNVLDAAAENSRVLLLSSVEIYGENRGDTTRFTESYCGWLDCNTLRAGYPEAKRLSEALCQAYIAQKAVDAVVLRLPRCYGPTMKTADSKAVAQFIKKAVAGQPIVLKSQGTQLYSYAHASDAVLGILWVLLRGETGQAYNLGDSRSDLTLRELAELAAGCAGTDVVFELPDELEKRGYSTASRALLDAAKLRALGWRAEYDIARGVRETIDILRELREEVRS